MCFMLYLGSNNDLPIATWDKKRPTVIISERLRRSGRRPRHFSTRNVYYVASDEGCGCGFRQADDVAFPDFSDIAQKTKNQSELYECLAPVLDNEDHIEFFGAWAGDERDVLPVKRTISLSDLLRDDFGFVNNELVKVTK